MKLNENKIYLGIIGLFSLVFLLLFQFTGLRLVLGFIVLFILPVYLILDPFKFTKLEKIAFSFFIGAGLFPTLIYYLGLIMSLRLAILIVFILLLVMGFIIRRFSNPGNE